MLPCPDDRTGAHVLLQETQTQFSKIAANNRSDASCATDGRRVKLDLGRDRITGPTYPEGVKAISRWLSAATPPDLDQPFPNPKGVAALKRNYPEGVTAISRWLSAATPPEDDQTKPDPEGVAANSTGDRR